MRIQFFSCASLILLVPGFAQALEETATRYEYAADGRIAAVHYGKGRSVVYHHDPAGNLTRIQVSVFVDMDNDGLDDVWETAHFGSMQRDGTGDFDQDGGTDRQEFIANTNPADPQSVFKLSSPELAADDLILRFNTVSGKRYQLFVKTDLSDPMWQSLGQPIQATGPVSVQIDPGAHSSKHRYYNVQVLP